MKVIHEEKCSHNDYADVKYLQKLTANSGKECEQRDLPCGQKSR